MTSINICVLMLVMYITTTESSEARFEHKKKLRKRGERDVLMSSHHATELHEDEEEPLQHPHSK